MTKVIVCDRCGEQIKLRKDLAVVFVLPKVHTCHRDCYKSTQVKKPLFYTNHLLINGLLFNVFTFLCPLLFIPVFYMKDFIDQFSHIFILLSILLIRATSYFKFERHIEK